MPPETCRQCIPTLADGEPLMTTLFQHRFKEGSLNGHSFGTLFIMAMAELTGDFEHAIRESGRVLAVRGQIVPSTLRDVTLIAEMADGQTRIGESSIPHANGDGEGNGAVATAIKRVFLQPEPTINPEAEEAILNAEMIIVGPGSLYTSILPNLVVDVVNPRVSTHHDPDKLARAIMKKIWRS